MPAKRVPLHDLSRVRPATAGQDGYQPPWKPPPADLASDFVHTSLSARGVAALLGYELNAAEQSGVSASRAHC